MADVLREKLSNGALAREADMGIVLSRAIRAFIGAAFYGVVAVAMYAILRALGNVSTPFDALQEFASVVVSFFKTAGAVLGGVGFNGLLLLMPPLPGQDGLTFLFAAIARAVEIIALFMVTAALLRVIAVISQGRKSSGP